MNPRICPIGGGIISIFFCPFLLFPYFQEVYVKLNLDHLYGNERVIFKLPVGGCNKSVAPYARLLAPNIHRLSHLPLSSGRMPAHLHERRRRTILRGHVRFYSLDFFLAELHREICTEDGSFAGCLPRHQSPCKVRRTPIVYSVHQMQSPRANTARRNT